ncbi:hypothetical protein D3C71_1067370 [compost metagenome]
MLHHLMHLTAAFQQRAGEVAQEVALVAVQLAGEATVEHGVQRGIEFGAALQIVEQVPERLEAAPGIGFANHIDAVEQTVEHVAARAFVVDDALAEAAVELLEVVAHAAEVFGQIIGQADHVAGAFQRALAVERGHLAAGGLGDLGVDAIALGAQCHQTRFGIGLGLLRQLRDLLHDHGQAAFRGQAGVVFNAGNEADGLHGLAREFVFLFAGAFRQPPLQPALGQPVGDVGLRGARQLHFQLFGVERVQLLLQALGQDRTRHTPVRFQQQALQQADKDGRAIGGQQLPQRLLAQALIAGNALGVLHRARAGPWINGGLGRLR